MSADFARRISGLVCAVCGSHHHPDECEVAQRYIAECRKPTLDDVPVQPHLDEVLRRSALRWAVERIRSVVEPLDQKASRYNSESGAVLPDDAPDQQIYLAELERLTPGKRA